MSETEKDESPDVSRDLSLGDDGWLFLSYETDPGTGFLIRDAQQDEPRLEILFWKADRQQDDTQLVIDAETGNIGIGTASPSDKLTISAGALSFQKSGESVSEMGLDYDDASQSLRIRARTGTATALNADALTIKKDGTVKAAAFEGSGAQLTEIKASSITEGVLAVDRVPSLPADRIPSLDRLNGQLPVEKISGQLSVEKIAGNLPIDRTSGQLPAERISGQLSQWVTSGSTISYTGNVNVGSQSGPDFPSIARNAIHSIGLSAIATMEISLTSAWNVMYPNQNSQGENAQVYALYNGTVPPERLAFRQKLYDGAYKNGVITCWSLDDPTYWSLNEIGDVVSGLNEIGDRIKSYIYPDERFKSKDLFIRMSLQKEQIQRMKDLSAEFDRQAQDPSQVRRLALEMAGLALTSATTAKDLWDNSTRNNLLVNDRERDYERRYAEKALSLLRLPGETGTGKISSPMWQASQPIANQTGPLPKQGAFITRGGTVLLFASGSGKTDKSSTPGNTERSGILLGMKVIVDNQEKGQAKIHSDFKNDHSAFVSCPLVITGLSPGLHVVRLENLNNDTATDTEDFFNVTIMELPF
jgi:hypothetical protein